MPGTVIVMPGLGPGIHDFAGSGKDVDGRNKSGHDDSKHRVGIHVLSRRYQKRGQ